MKLLKLLATALVLSIVFSFFSIASANPNQCISLTTGSAGTMTFAATFRNNCDKCVTFTPRAVGLGGSSDLLMGAAKSLGHPVSRATLEPGGTITLFYGGTFGTWKASALNPKYCD
ncbi:MAG: hypothetical protein ACRBBN_12495 [Methyloligellaceae bacterium]